jgi:hypothetical protein
VPKTIDNRTALELAASKKVTPLEPFPGAGFLPWSLSCDECNRVFETTYTALRTAKEFGCSDCGIASARAIKAFKQNLKALALANWELLTSSEDFEVGQGVVVECSLCSTRVAGDPHLLKSKLCECVHLERRIAKLRKAQSIAAARGGLLLSEDFAGVKAKHAWACQFGHVWWAQYQSVVGESGTWCPFCSGRQAVSGSNDLATVNPLLAEEFDVARNAPLCREELLPSAHSRVYWLCSRGHSYQARVSNRQLLGTGCPYCSGHKVLEGFNDLATTEPEIALLWHPSKNGDLKPSQVKRTSNIPVWWICSEGHESESYLPDKTRARGSCVVCSGRRLERGQNDLSTRRPDLAAEWHPTKNGDLSPTDVVAFSNKRVWWLCKRGHDWRNQVNHRSRGSGCPFCANKRCWPGFNDLATTYPELLAEWDFGNNTIEPSEVIAGGRHSVNWICPEGHGGYMATTLGRAILKQGCPSCVHYGFNPLEPAVCYFLANPKLGACKVGITNAGQGRLKAFERSGWEILHTWNSQSGYAIRALEAALLKGWLKGELELAQFLGRDDMSGLNGHTETFSADAVTPSEIISKGNFLFGQIEKNEQRDPTMFRLGLLGAQRQPKRQPKLSL